MGLDRRLIRALAGAAFAAAACACTPSGDGTTPGEAAQPSQSPSSAPLPTMFAQTAWRSTSEDGSSFTTYLDDGGRYRDVRDGEPWQDGTWDFDKAGDGRLCLTPKDPNGVERCWEPDTMRDGKLIMTSSADGHRIALERVDYALPEGTRKAR